MWWRMRRKGGAVFYRCRGPHSGTRPPAVGKIDVQYHRRKMQYQTGKKFKKRCREGGNSKRDVISEAGIEIMGPIYQFLQGQYQFQRGQNATTAPTKKKKKKCWKEYL